MSSSEEILDKIRADNRSGASTLYTRALEYLRAAIDELSTIPAADLIRELAKLPDKIRSAKPEMAPFVNLANGIRRHLEQIDSESDPLDSMCNWVDRLATKDAESPKKLASHASGLIPDGSRILTISMSSSIVAVFEHHPARETLSVVVPEGRPMCEGVDLAQKLDDFGVPAEVIADLAVERYIADCDLFLTGADAVTEEYLVNKIGTGIFAGLMRSAGKKTVAVFAENKLVSASDFAFEPEMYPPEEISDVALSHGRVTNFYFESVDLSRFSQFVTDSGIKSLSELKRLVRYVSL